MDNDGNIVSVGKLLCNTNGLPVITAFADGDCVVVGVDVIVGRKDTDKLCERFCVGINDGPKDSNNVGPGEILADSISVNDGPGLVDGVNDEKIEGDGSRVVVGASE